MRRTLALVLVVLVAPGGAQAEPSRDGLFHLHGGTAGSDVAGSCNGAGPADGTLLVDGAFVRLHLAGAVCFAWEAQCEGRLDSDGVARGWCPGGRFELRDLQLASPPSGSATVRLTIEASGRAPAAGEGGCPWTVVCPPADHPAQDELPPPQRPPVQTALVVWSVRGEMEGVRLAGPAGGSSPPPTRTTLVQAEDRTRDASFCDGNEAVRTYESPAGLYLELPASGCWAEFDGDWIGGGGLVAAMLNPGIGCVRLDVSIDGSAPWPTGEVCDAENGYDWRCVSADVAMPAGAHRLRITAQRTDGPHWANTGVDYLLSSERGQCRSP